MISIEEQRKILIQRQREGKDDKIPLLVFDSRFRSEEKLMMEHLRKEWKKLGFMVVKNPFGNEISMIKWEEIYIHIDNPQAERLVRSILPIIELHKERKELRNLMLFIEEKIKKENTLQRRRELERVDEQLKLMEYAIEKLKRI